MNDANRSTDRVSILVVDDEESIRGSLRALFAAEGYEVETAADPAEAIVATERRSFDIAIIDLRMPGIGGLELQSRLATARPEMVRIIMTAYASIDTAVFALKSGAFDYVVKPFDPDELLHLVRRAHEHRHPPPAESPDIHGPDPEAAAAAWRESTPGLERVRQVLQAIAPTDTTVLLHGETGVDFVSVVREIHLRSARAHRPLERVDCESLPAADQDLVLFGGASPAARERVDPTRGKLEATRGGTVFLDEVGALGRQPQSRLLEVLERKMLCRPGAGEWIPVDVRLIASTAHHLASRVSRGEFRQDLYWRLGSVMVEIPPLRERPEDVVSLARAYLGHFGRTTGRGGLELAPDAMAALQAHVWPGNERELRDAMEWAVTRCAPPRVRAGDLPDSVSRPEPSRSGSRSLAAVERAHIQAVLTENAWQLESAARILDVDPATLASRMEELGIVSPAGPTAPPPTLRPDSAD